MRRLIIKNSYGLEIWKDIEGYEGKYQVSTLGRVKSLEREIEYTSRWGKRGVRHQKEFIMSLNYRKYVQIMLTKNGIDRQTYSIHSLVGNAFLPKKIIDTEVDHINANKYDNRVENLRWVTHQENNENPLRLEKLKKRYK